MKCMQWALVQYLLWTSHDCVQASQQSRKNRFIAQQGEAREECALPQRREREGIGECPKDDEGSFLKELSGNCSSAVDLRHAFATEVRQCSCLQFLASDARLRPCIPRQHFSIFSYWSGSCAKNANLRLLLYTYLETQGKNTSFTLWLHGTKEEVIQCTQALTVLHNDTHRVKIKALDDQLLSQLCRRLPKDDALRKKCESFNSLNAAYAKQSDRSDFIRFLLLYTFGGLYVDTDVIFRRDLSPLLSLMGQRDFAYRWQNQSFLNNAVFSVPLPQSTLLNDIYMHHSRGKRPLFAFGLTSACQRRPHCATNFIILPTPLFDPFWLLKFDTYTYSGLATPGRFHLASQLWLRALNSSFHNEILPGAFLFHTHMHPRDFLMISSFSYFGQLLASSRFIRNNTE